MARIQIRASEVRRSMGKWIVNPLLKSANYKLSLAVASFYISRRARETYAVTEGEIIELKEKPL